MSVRLSITLPDELHAQLSRIAAASHVSLAAAARTILADTVPKLTSVLEYLGTHPTPERAVVTEVDAWADEMRRLLQTAPEPFRDLRESFDEFEGNRSPEGAEGGSSVSEGDA